MSKILNFYRNIIVENANNLFNKGCVASGFAFYIAFYIISVSYLYIHQ